jgi:hypothetical protein
MLDDTHYNRHCPLIQGVCQGTSEAKRFSCRCRGEASDLSDYRKEVVPNETPPLTVPTARGIRDIGDIIEFVQFALERHTHAFRRFEDITVW